jgi:hydrogenase-4 component E
MTIVDALNALVLGLFIVVTISMTVVRQVGACMQAFVGQSLLLAASAFLLGSSPLSWHLIALGCVTLVSKVLLIPWLLGTLVPTEIHRRREITQALDVPISLLLALGLSFVAYFLGEHLVRAAPSLASGNVSMGIAGVLVGLLLLAVRAEAVPQLLGILSMENGAFLAGIAIAPNFPLIAEFAIAFDVLLLAFIATLLTRMAYRDLGITEVAALSELRETGP